MEKILFLSALDFKEKSIQVIKKTPEYYQKNDWDVTYIVLRDESFRGNYFYEKKIEIKGVNLIRKSVLFSKSDLTKYVIFNKIRYLLSIFILLKEGIKIMKKNKDIKVIYGYEVHGVLATNLLKLLFFKRDLKIVSRFQGTFLYSYFSNRKYKKILSNFESILALYLPSDLCIMTDDGTKGDLALKLLKSKNLNNLIFLKNGVDNCNNVSDEIINSTKQEYGIDFDKKIILTVSRLVSWKRIDRSIEILKEIYEMDKNFLLVIVGEGDERLKLEKIVEDYQLNYFVKFIGGIPHKKVEIFQEMASYFFSFYEGSNVGNPLLEMIKRNKIIFTLDNGDTSKIIIHKKNGLIYSENEFDANKIAKDLLWLDINESIKNKLRKNLKHTEKEILITWDERLKKEEKEIKKILNIGE